jgi:hypothetical protein
MSLSKDKSPLSTVVSVELKEKLQRIATAKKWTLSHTVKLFIESFIDTWEKELGIDSDLTPRAQRAKTKKPTPAVAATTKTKRSREATVTNSETKEQP